MNHIKLKKCGKDGTVV